MKFSRLKKVSVLFLFIFSIRTSCIFAQQMPVHVEKPPALSAIKKADLKSDIFVMAGDSMRGRRAGTIDEMKAAAWVAERAREAGLEPAGERGTYFQFFSLYRSTVDESSTMSINQTPVELWRDAWITAPVEVDLKAPVTWFDAMPDSTMELQNKVVAVNLMPPARLPAEGMSLWNFRYVLSALRGQGAALKKQGAAAIILVADSTALPALPYLGLTFHKGSYRLQASSSQHDGIPVILVRRKWKSQLRQQDAHISAHISADHFTYPSVNVVAKAPGADSRLKDEYVLFSGHIDHEGVGLIPVRGDSIWNGADDNASTSVALLAIARAWTKAPAKRSGLFVWHGAEERGLFGSRYFAGHPTVKKDAIVAVLNGDLIGRNDPDSAALLGAIPPHRNSKDLVNAAMQTNHEFTKFKVDTLWDAADHPEHWYFRSDHLPYARVGIPSIFFTTLLHADYHTPQDNPDRIDIDKLAKMTRWMYATGWNVANTEQRPALDDAKK